MTESGLNMKDPLRGGKVLVTGGAGFIGSHLVDHLLDSTGLDELRVLDNFSTGRTENLSTAQRDRRFRLLEGDIRSEVAVRSACEGVDVVFHLACLGVRHSLHRPQENHEVNATGSLRLLEAARQAGAQRFVHVSTSEVFGTAQRAPMDETHPTWPETVYGGSKLAGEAYARAFHRTHGFPTVVVRPFNNYGTRSHFEGDSGEVIPRSIVRVLAGLPPIVFGDGSQTRDFLHVSDCVRALSALAASDAAIGETVNVGFGEEYSIADLVRLVAELAGHPDLEPIRLDHRPGDVGRLWVDNRKAQALIDFQPCMTMKEGLQELIEWFAARPEGPAAMVRQVAERNWGAEAS